MHIIPYIIPSTLPFTVPVSLLFSVTVVYGRLAGDNEIIAVKSSGQSMIVLWPTILFAAGISGSPSSSSPRPGSPTALSGQAGGL